MIWMTRKNNDSADAATGTFADGLFPLLAAQELANWAPRTFRTSYGQDYSSARKRELPDLQSH